MDPESLQARAISVAELYDRYNVAARRGAWDTDPARPADGRPSGEEAAVIQHRGVGRQTSLRMSPKAR